jgi:hypothetical protein
MNIKASAIALAVVAAIGWGVAQRKELGRPEDSASRHAAARQRAAVPASAPQAGPPGPFAAADARGHTPGDDVDRYVAMGTPAAGFDAWALIDACERAERHALPDRAERCNGITQQHRRKAGELLGTAMMAGVHGAAVAYMKVIWDVPREELAQGRRDNPNIDTALKTAVEKLEEAAQRELRAIQMLARLYRHADPVTGKRDPERALMYTTAERELKGPAPGFEKSQRMLLDELTTGLTPEQIKRAREAGLQLARQCDCKEG